MENWMIAAVPPLLVWFGLWMYLAKVDRRLRDLDERMR